MPALRFRGFYDAWEQRKLGELTNSFEYGLNASAKKFDGIHKYIRITDIDDSSRKFNSDSITSPDINFSSADNYELKQNDLLFARTGASVGKSYIYTESDGLVYYAGFLIRVRIKPEFDSNFVFQNTFTSSYENFIRITSQRSGQPGVNSKEYASFEISIPSLEEQQMIGSLFKQLDNLTAQNERKIDLLKQLKQAYLQKIFSQELRFAGFNDDWEERKIVDLFEERSERSPHGQMISITMGSGVVLASSLDRKDNSSFDKSNYKVVRKNDIAYNSMRMWQGASGVSPYNGIVSPAYTIITPKDNVDSGFFAIQFKMAKSLKTFQKYSQGLTSDTWNLKYPALSSIPMITPNFTEQKKINHFFGIFDDLIDKYEKKVLLLKRKKRSYLQKMFV